MRYGFVGPYGSANLGDYGILVNNIFDIVCKNPVVFSYNYNWPKYQLDHYCQDIDYDYCVVRLKDSINDFDSILKMSDDQILSTCQNINEIREKIAAIDTLILSGGGWLNFFWAERKDKACKIAIVILLSKEQHKNIKFAVQGLGPFHDSKNWYKRLLGSTTNPVFVRDKTSIKLAEDIEHKAILAPDDLSLPSEYWQKFQSILPPPISKVYCNRNFQTLRLSKKDRSANNFFRYMHVRKV